MGYCIVLGFVGHKVVAEVYDYQFQKGFDSRICILQYEHDLENSQDRRIFPEDRPNPFSERVRCAKDEMGVFGYLEFLLLRPHMSNPFRRGWSD